MSGQELLVGLLVAIAGTVIGGIILAALLSLAWQAWRVEQEERLVRAFLGLARELVRHYDTLVAPLSANKAAARARVRDPGPVLERLRRKGHIRRVPDDPGYYTITAEGRTRALASPWWRFW